MKLLLTTTFFLAFVIKCFCIEITGIITDTETGQPVEYASVYVNGTTIGTTTDTKGKFSLRYKFDYCRIVINHVNYEYEVVDISPDNHQNLTIEFNPKNIEIEPVVVQTRNLRGKSLAYFKKTFLGDDSWGQSAVILNDSILHFKTVNFGDDAPVNDLKGKIKYFEVKATAPLLIDLPKLGYHLQYDMLRFVESYDPKYGHKIINNLGYFYFREYADVSRLQEMRFRRNRYKVYYHSIMHFVRSFYENKLAENGYDLFIANASDSSNTYTPFLFDSCECITFKNDEAYLCGAGGSEIIIHYYTNNFRPINLKKYEGDESWRILSGLDPAASTVLYIEKDTCVFRKDGTLPGGGQMIFNGDIAKKRYGAILPSDFEP